MLSRRDRAPGSSPFVTGAGVLRLGAPRGGQAAVFSRSGPAVGAILGPRVGRCRSSPKNLAALVLGLAAAAARPEGAFVITTAAFDLLHPGAT